MAKKHACKYNTKKGRCGKEAIGSVVCEQHRNRKCHICGKTAYMDCPWPGCKVRLCNSPACIDEHLNKIHEGRWPHNLADPKKERKNPREAREPDEKAYNCVNCEKEPPELVSITQGENGGKASFSYIECPHCKMRGPQQPSPELARKRWNDLPRGRPPIYQRIRKNALEFLDRELQAYVDSVDVEKSSVEDVVAVAKALEAATVAVDTWE